MVEIVDYGLYKGIRGVPMYVFVSLILSLLMNIIFGLVKLDQANPNLSSNFVDGCIVVFAIKRRIIIIVVVSWVRCIGSVLQGFPIEKIGSRLTLL